MKHTVDQAKSIMKEVFGYSEFRHQQEEAILSLLDDKDVLLILPTGGGKSLCYQVPALMFEGLALVVSPLIALMLDQVAQLKAQGVRAAYLNSSLEQEHQAEVLQSVRDGTLDLLYIAPERLLFGHTLDVLRSAKLSLLAIDEAHCVSEWGPDFRSDYLQLHRLKSIFPDVPCIAVTASADAKTRIDIKRLLGIPNASDHIGSFERSNLFYRVVEKQNVKKQLLTWLRARSKQSGIIYCATRRRVDEFAELLQEEGLQAMAYHAGKSMEVRDQAQQAFMSGSCRIMVATLAFGMGIHHNEIRYVVHLDMPSSVEAYYQQTGRAGRDGQPAEALMFYGFQDMQSRWLRAARAGEANEKGIIEQFRLQKLLEWIESSRCRNHGLLNYFDEEAALSCRHCDLCSKPMKITDVTLAMQWLFDVMAQNPNRLTATKLVDAMLGKGEEPAYFRGNAWGQGKAWTGKAWLQIIRKCVVRGYLAFHTGMSAALYLTAKGEAWLKCDAETQFLLLPPPSKNLPNQNQHLSSTLARSLV